MSPGGHALNDKERGTNGQHRINRQRVDGQWVDGQWVDWHWIDHWWDGHQLVEQRVGQPGDLPPGPGGDLAARGDLQRREQPGKRSLDRVTLKPGLRPDRRGLWPRRGL